MKVYTTMLEKVGRPKWFANINPYGRSKLSCNIITPDSIGGGVKAADLKSVSIKGEIG